MVTVIGVRFRCAAKLYYFDPGEEQYVRGDLVIVETARGREMGTVSIPNREIADEEIVQPLKPVLRRATEQDLKTKEDNKAREEEAARICREKIEANGLEMKLVAVEYTFDENKVIFYFTADGRVDFRELVKDLAAVFRTRIELRQIGVRDETKIKGGIGICGRPLCCHSYLTDFVSVSIKMAKEQNLSLNPTKISGVCGRLMCCLKNEEDTYEFLNSQLPGIGDTVSHRADQITGTVQGVNVLRQTVKVIVDNNGDPEIKEYPVDELSFHGRYRGEARMKQTEAVAEAELEQLEELEEREEAIEKRTDEEMAGETGRKPHRDQRRKPQSDAESDRQEGGRRYNRGKRDSREGREERDGRDNREKRENRENRDNRGGSENRESHDRHDSRKGSHESRDGYEGRRDHRGSRQINEGGANKASGGQQNSGEAAGERSGEKKEHKGNYRPRHNRNGKKDANKRGTEGGGTN